MTVKRCYINSFKRLCLTVYKKTKKGGFYMNNIDLKRAKQDIQDDYYQIVNANYGEYQLMIVYEKAIGKVLIHLSDCKGFASWMTDKEEFIELSEKQFYNLLNSILYYNYQEEEEDDDEGRL